MHFHRLKLVLIALILLYLAYPLHAFIKACAQHSLRKTTYFPIIIQQHFNANEPKQTQYHANNKKQTVWHNDQSLAFILLNSVALLWGSQHVIIKAALITGEQNSAALLNLWRFTFSTLLFSPAIYSTMVSWASYWVLYSSTLFLLT